MAQVTPERPSTISEALNRITSHAATPAFALYALNLFLLSPVFFISLVDLGVWDQPAYIASGQQLMDGGLLPPFAGNPLTSIFYALTYLPFRSSPLWMVHSCTLGRVLLFSLLWVTLYLIGKELSEKIPALLLPGFLLITPLAAEVLTFPSDPLFAGLAGLSFWQLLRYERNHRYRSLSLASFFLGLAALARNDGLVLFPILIVLALVIGWRKENWFRNLMAVILPYAILVGGYILVYGFATGNFDLGTSARTYGNFESGHQLLLEASEDINHVIEARIQAREVFGTAAENGNNVFKAILRNPAIYFLRVKLLLNQFPTILLSAYGKRFSPLIFLLALQGIWLLLKKREWRRLALFILWPAHLVTGLIITIIRPGHLTFVYFIVYALAAMGLTELISYPPRWKIRSVWILGMLILGGYGLADNKLAFFYAASVFLFSLLIIGLIQQRSLSASRNLSLLVLFAAGVILRQGYPSPHLRHLDESEPEQAVIFMSENLPATGLVAAGSPGLIQAAKMPYFGLASADTPYDLEPEEFLLWMQGQGVNYVFADYSLVSENARIWALLEPALGNQLEQVFISSGGDIRIFELSPALP